MSADRPRDIPKMKSKKSFSNLRKRLLGSEGPELLPPEPLNPPRLRTTSPSVPMLRDRTSIARLQTRAPSKPPRLPLSPGAADDPSVAQGPRFMSMEQVTGIGKVHYIPRCKYNIPRAKMPTVWGVPPSRTKKRRVAPPRVSRPMRIVKALGHPDRLRKKCKGMVKSFVQKKLAQRLDRCIRAFQVEEEEEQKPLENIEYKPIYRLKEIKRASILLGLPKPKRPMSFASVDTTSSTVDRQRYSDASIYSRRMSAAGLPTGYPEEQSSSHEMNSEEDLSLRASLLPYREWWAFLQSRTNPFTDNTSTNDRSSSYGTSGISATATPIHNEQEEHHPRNFFHSIFASRSSFSARVSQNFSNFLRKSSNFESIEDKDEPAPPSPTSSELTITPFRFSLPQNMSEGPEASSKDPVAESADSKDMAKEATQETASVKSKDAENKGKESEGGSKVQKDLDFSMDIPQAEKLEKKEASPKDDIAPGDAEGTAQGKLDENKNRIPHPYAQKSYQGLARGIRATPEHRSAIPVAVRKQSTGSGGTGSGETTPSAYNEGFAGGIRVLDKPSGPRSRAIDETPSHPAPESVKGVEAESTMSNWDLDDGEEEIQKPPTVFTGEFRTRPSDRLRQSSHGPTLRIAGSADNIIMGTDDRLKSSIVTQRSSPARVQYVEKVKSDSPQDPGSTSEGKSVPAQKEQSPMPNFCRPKVSLEHLPKRDISNRELAVARKPLGRPSFTNIFAPSAEHLRVEHTPPVPKVSVSKDGTVQTSSPLAKPKSVDSATQTPDTAHQHSGASAGSTTDPMNKMMGPLRSHPPPLRTSSLQAVTDFSMNTDAEAGSENPDDMPVKEQEAGHLKHQQIESSRIPDPKSNRMIDSFRSIFKHKGAAEKARVKKGEPNEVPMLPKDQSVVSVKSIKAADEKAASIKPAPKGKAKHSMGWNKVARNPKASGENSPAFVPTPNSALSASLPTPLNRSPLENLTPSFARPTQSTRTKAAVSGSKPLSAGQEGRPRRIIQGAAASTGSPQRPTRVGVKRPSMASGNKQLTISSPRPITPAKGQENNPTSSSDIDAKKPEPAQASFKDIDSCVAKLCKKACDESTAEKREKHLRLALSLQQQLSDFRGTEKEAEEAQMLFNSKKSDKDTARDTLFEYFSQVRMQLDEE